MTPLFGGTHEQSLRPQDVPALADEARANACRIATTPIEMIIMALHRVGRLWTPDGLYFRNALKVLPQELAMSTEMIEMSLALLPDILNSGALRSRLEADFGALQILDGFSKYGRFKGRTRFVPHGILLHVTAGNIFLGAIDSLVMGLLTKNINIIKLSSSNLEFSKLFIKSVLEADIDKILSPAMAFVHWSGGDEKVETALKKKVDAIVAWGGDDMIKSYRRDLPPGVPLIEHGPKISFQVMTKHALQDMGAALAGRLIAKDIILWDQAACASPQNLFVEMGAQRQELLDQIAENLDRATPPRGELMADEIVEILKEEHRGVMTSSQGGQILKGESWLIHFDPRPGIRPSPLNRTLIVKEFENIDDLLRQLEPAKKSLQSCSYALAPEEMAIYQGRLSSFGVLRFAPLGTVMEGLTGAPHDGRLSLMELGRMTPDESQETVLSFVNDAIHNVAFYKKLYQGKKVQNFKDLIPVKTLEISLPETSANGGHIFSSGGTSGNPKFIFFSNEEFKNVGELLARGYRSQGLKPSTLCANLFVAGNMWSSFLAVNEALSQCGAVQLPIGGLADPSLILGYLAQFKPRAVFGLPSLLIDLANRSIQNHASIEIPTIFYAGEHLTSHGRAVLERAWGTREFYSAGYASVDAGPIGYQCPHCRPNEHHLFEDFVHLEIQDGEGIVTSLVRRETPIIHLRTGDHLEWSDGERCLCGSSERRFMLHGRIDGQIRIWSSRVLFSEIEDALKDAGVGPSVFQVELKDTTTNGQFSEIMTIRYEGGAPADENLVGRVTAAFYQRAKDVKATHSLKVVEERLKLEQVPGLSLTRLPRTGKIRPVIDQRAP